MADVRALLRNERLARRITHPHATYSSAGTLSCSVCNLRLQAESLWKPHLAGKVHRSNLQRLQSSSVSVKTTTQPGLETSSPAQVDIAAASVTEGIAQRNVSGNGKKRKVEDDSDDEVPQISGKKRKAADSESEEDDGQNTALRKRSRTTTKSELTDNTLARGPNFEDPNNNHDVLVQSEAVADSSTVKSSANIDEDEYAAFEAAIAAAPAQEDDTAQEAARNLLHGGGDIAAAPVTNAELAAKDVEDPNIQRKSKRDEELEEEKEDAARALEDEFDEMDQLESRVKRLRERREALRANESGREMEIQAQDEEESDQSVVHPESDADDDDDYEDEWGFR